LMSQLASFPLVSQLVLRKQSLATNDDLLAHRWIGEDYIEGP